MILVVKLLYCQIVSLLRAYAIRPYKSYLLSITGYTLRVLFSCLVYLVVDINPCL